METSGWHGDRVATQLDRFPAVSSMSKKNGSGPEPIADKPAVLQLFPALELTRSYKSCVQQVVTPSSFRPGHNRNNDTESVPYRQSRNMAVLLLDSARRLVER